MSNPFDDIISAVAAARAIQDATAAENAKLRAEIERLSRPPAPTPAPPPPLGIKVPIGGKLPTVIGAGETILLERGGVFDTTGLRLGVPHVTIDGGSFGDAAKPEATLRCISTNGYPELVRVAAGSITLRDLRLTSTNDETKGVAIDAADCRIENLTLVGPNFLAGLQGHSGCERLRVKGYGATERIRGASWYGRGSDIIIDLDGRTLPGSLEENVIRTIRVQTFTIRNGTILAPPVTSPSSGNPMVKSWITVQDGSTDLTAEHLTTEGVAGIGPIFTNSGPQMRPVINTTLRRITTTKGRQIGITEGARNTTLEDIIWHQADGRAVIEFGGADNPHFNEKPDVIVRRFASTGGPSFVTGAERGLLKIEAGVTHNGKAVR